jgi:hypothetical protein
MKNEMGKCWYYVAINFVMYTVHVIFVVIKIKATDRL